MTANNVIAWPGSPQHREAEATELQRLQQMEADLSRPIVELARELAYLRGVEAAATAAMAKVDEHRYKGFENIKVGAFARLGKALEARP
jgi:hypothetical protein